MTRRNYRAGMGTALAIAITLVVIGSMFGCASPTAPAKPTITLTMTVEPSYAVIHFETNADRVAVSVDKAEPVILDRHATSYTVDRPQEIVGRGREVVFYAIVSRDTATASVKVPVRSIFSAP